MFSLLFPFFSGDASVTPQQRGHLPIPALQRHVQRRTAPGIHRIEQLPARNQNIRQGNGSGGNGLHQGSRRTARKHILPGQAKPGHQKTKHALIPRFHGQKKRLAREKPN